MRRWLQTLEHEFAAAFFAGRPICVRGSLPCLALLTQVVRSGEAGRAAALSVGVGRAYYVQDACLEDCLFTFHSDTRLPPRLFGTLSPLCYCWLETRLPVAADRSWTIVSLCRLSNKLQSQSPGNAILGPRFEIGDGKFGVLYLTSNCCFSAVLPSSDTQDPFCASGDTLSAGGGFVLPRPMLAHVPQHWMLCAAIGRPRSETNGGSRGGGDRWNPGHAHTHHHGQKISLGGFGRQGCWGSRGGAGCSWGSFGYDCQRMPANCPSRRQNRAAKRRAAGEVESIKIKDHSLEPLLPTVAPLKSDERTHRQAGEATRERRGLPCFPTPCNNTLRVVEHDERR